ncbi:MAG: hypothetical protein MUE44_29560 [Oscillatoriaceae cyanobacterium Prado104]|jgi:hypothetical protein|nr:hypothetical protein [Oscillatoriaceae cyanobacterium Prado104]
MPNIQKLCGIAAFINAAVAVTTLMVAVFAIGLPALADPSKLVDLAIHNPAPLLAQDFLKLVAAAISGVLILAFYNRLHDCTPQLILVATVFGCSSVVCLVANAALSLYAIFQVAAGAAGAFTAGDRLHSIIGLLAIATIILDGFWFLLVSWSALKSDRLPKLLSYLGLGMGFLSLVPPLGIVVLILSSVWSVWLGQILLQEG